MANRYEMQKVCGGLLCVILFLPLVLGCNSPNDAGGDTEADSATETDSDADVDSDTDSDWDGDSDSDGDADSDTDSAADTDHDTDSDSAGDTGDTGKGADTDSDSDTEDDKDTNTDLATEHETDTDSETDSGADTGSESDTETGTGLDVDTGTPLETCNDGIYEGDFVAAAHPGVSLKGCIEIQGSLIVERTDLKNMAPFSTIEKVRDSVRIVANTQLANIRNLANLNSIGGNLIFDYVYDDPEDPSYVLYDNGVLQSFEGLEGITEIPGDLVIHGCQSVTDMTGFNNLQSIGGNAMISRTRLVSLTGLESLTTVGGDLILFSTGFNGRYADGCTTSTVGNPRLLSLSGLSALTSVGSIAFSSPHIKNLEGLGSLTSVDTLTIGGCNECGGEGDDTPSCADNRSLESFDGLSESFSADKVVFGAEVGMTDLEELHRINSLRSFSVGFYDSYADKCGAGTTIADISALVEIPSIREITLSCIPLEEIDLSGISNIDVLNISGIPGDNSVKAPDLKSAGDITISDDDLTDVDFSALETVTGTLELSGLFNPGGDVSVHMGQLTEVGYRLALSTIGIHVLELENLVSVGDAFSISYTSVTSVSVPKLTSVGRGLGIRYNSSLPDCTVCDILSQLSTAPVDTEFERNFADECTPLEDTCLN